MSDRTIHIDEHNKYLLNPPHKTRSAYSDRTAWLMGVLSNLAYIPFEDDPNNIGVLAHELSKLELEIVALFHAKRADVDEMSDAEKTAAKGKTKTDTQAMLVQSSKSAPHQFAALAFRGSEMNKTDWITTDADATWVNMNQDSDKDGKPELVHRGFFVSYISVRSEIENVLHSKEGGLSLDKQELDIADYDPSIPFYVTGHSLGAALATVAARELEAQKIHDIAAVYTYGSPRVGNPEWAATLKCPIFRVINHRDAVGLLPPSSFLGNIISRMGWGRLVEFSRRRLPGYIGYQHVGDIRFLTGKGELKKGSDATMERLLDVFFDLGWAISRRSLQFFGKAKDLGLDHIMTNYIEKLEGIAKRRNPN